MAEVEKLQQEQSEHISRILEHSKITSMKGSRGLSTIYSTNSNIFLDQDVNEKLRVCDICGAFLSIYDSDK